MYNSNKRPTTSKPFNPAHTHPASISSLPSIQTRQHISAASSSNDKSSVPPEGIQSGGGGGGGAGAGSSEGIDGLGDDEKKESNKEGKGNNTDSDPKWSDPKVVHPAWEGFGKGPAQEEKATIEDKKRDGKSKL
ncbi:uncharacterized protein IL334_001064 [Kwoniella shivajii]|uniref:Uncharacterized protein n=1 Tax=Kwoniella shivajii TaxID=564305 RepID=A0ABZ1CQW8_9TREE|nr:hypothetical protein IL334_001064 [Kwoniella shivajii]